MHNVIPDPDGKGAMGSICVMSVVGVVVGLLLGATGHTSGWLAFAVLGGLVGAVGAYRAYHSNKLLQGIVASLGFLAMFTGYFMYVMPLDP